MTYQFKKARPGLERKDAASEPTVTEIKTAIEEIGKTFEEFKQKNDQEIAEIKKGKADPVTKDQVDKINDVITELNKKFRDLETRANRGNLGGQADDEDSESKAEHKTAFEAWFRKGRGEGELRTVEQKAFNTQSDPDGGYLVPEEMDTAIDRVLGTVSVMRTIAQVRQIGTSTYKKLVNVGGSSSGWVGETDSRPETTTAQLKELTFNAMELYANPAATQSMLDDGMIDLGAWIADEISTEFAEQEGAAFITGNGVAQPRGILAYEKVANASYVFGKTGFIISGADGAFKAAASAPADCLIDLQHALKSGYRNGASWLMNDLTAAAVRKIKDTDGNYLWRPGLMENQPDMLLGKPVNYDDNMPDMETDSFSIAFGNFPRAYLIVDRVGARVLRDPYSNKPYVHFYTTKRVGGGIQKFEAIKLLKFAQS